MPRSRIDWTGRVRRLGHRALALCWSWRRTFRAPWGIGGNAAGSFAIGASALSAGAPSNTATISRLDSYGSKAHLADWREFSTVFRRAGCFGFRGDAGDSIEYRSRLAASSEIQLRNLADQIDSGLANQERDVGDDDILVIQEDEVGRSRSQRLEHDRAIVAGMNVNDIWIADQYGLEGPIQHQ